jgi:8-oxo-dGTP diphosphatase
MRSVSVKGVLVRDGTVLLLEYVEPSLHYNFPGGKVREGESLYDALRRTCAQEIQLDVEPDRLLAVAEYDPRTWSGRWGDVPKLQLNFLVSAGGEPALPEVFHEELVPSRLCWTPIAALETIDLLPRIGATVLSALRSDQEWDPLCQYVLGHRGIDYP